MKFALVCGASGNIGMAISRRLAEQGWSLYLHYHQHAAAVEELVQELQRQYPKQDFLMVQADFRNEAAAEEIGAQIFSLDAIVFAQGTTIYQLFDEFDGTQLENLWLEHLKVPLLVIKKLVSKLAEGGHGRIVFIGSVYGAVGSAMEVPYSMLKGAMSSFANAYAKEVASLGITVNVVAPGAVQTQMNANFAEDEIEAISEEIPVGRFAKPDEIAYLVETVLAETASYLTGQTIYVDGGWQK
ncbi:elongation factor P 5-aminopentanone reductase [Pediococcus acidilactici]|uniref:elongation factor P 5-aminopentanone reductase n=1 Tax=Pediococcus acidilactici TaxID=1254 RepID=UPI00194E9B7D|nr:SDR family oxidoreductase [Pediococcus acidilactici]MBM6585632.1 SDR family oxidoreductase [Pediococcus acidilactici]